MYKYVDTVLTRYQIQTPKFTIAFLHFFSQYRLILFQVRKKTEDYSKYHVEDIQECFKIIFKA